MKTKGLNFMEAMKELNFNQKIRSFTWDKSQYMQRVGDSIFMFDTNSDKKVRVFLDKLIDTFVFNEWEIVYEPIPLWFFRSGNETDGFYYKSKDVCESIKYFISCFEVLKNSENELDRIRYNVILTKAKEIFGEQLLDN